MTSEDIDEGFDLFKDICIDSDESDSDHKNYSSSKNLRQSYTVRPLPPPEPEEYVDFEEYVRNKCENRIKILDRSTFHHIQRPIIISFNHFREKCYYHTKWLDRLYELSLKYGDRIEFIVADQIEMDLMYPNRNPINFFCYLVKPEDEGIHMYAIDTKKRIHEYFDCYKTIENLSELCENLLSGKLYPSQPIPMKNDTLVKICVHLNYDELVTESTKNILLIVGLGDYRPNEENEPNYEAVAKDLEDSNVDIVYIDGDKNYVPFKFSANCYPTILFIPCHDKQDFVHFNEGPRDTENLMKFINDNLGTQGSMFRQKQISKLSYKPFTLPENTDMHLEDFNSYIEENFPNSLQVLDRKTFNKAKRSLIIYFMDFSRNGVAFYEHILKAIHQVAEGKYGYGVDYFVADLKDIDVIYPKWWTKINWPDMEMNKDVPQVYAIDRMQRTYKLDTIKTSSSLFYASYRLTYSYFFYSEPWAVIRDSDLVGVCVGHNLNMFIKNSRKNIFLAVYWDKELSLECLNTLNEIANDLTDTSIKMLKIDARWNYVPLEYRHTEYPVYFFIPRNNKEEGTMRHTCKDSKENKMELLKFIRENVST